MGFKIELKTYNNLSKNDIYLHKTYNDDFDNYISVLIDICDLLKASRAVKLTVDGFNGLDWNLACDWDLLCIAESFDETLYNMVNKNYNFSLEFFEQGIERVLEFKAIDFNLVEINCLSFVNREPLAEKIFINGSALKIMIVQLVKDFIGAASQVCGYLLDVPLIKEYLNKINALIL